MTAWLFQGQPLLKNAYYARFYERGFITMKQETKLVAIILAALIVFLSGFGLGATRGITITVEGGAAVQTVATAAPAETTTAASDQCRMV